MPPPIFETSSSVHTFLVFCLGFGEFLSAGFSWFSAIFAAAVVAGAGGGDCAAWPVPHDVCAAYPYAMEAKKMAAVKRWRSMTPPVFPVYERLVSAGRRCANAMAFSLPARGAPRRPRFLSCHFTSTNSADSPLQLRKAPPGFTGL